MRLVILAALLVSACSAEPLTVGVYDSRAIAIAYAPSMWNEQFLQALESRLAIAKKDGDAKLMAVVAESAKQRQTDLHRQTFGTLSVKELLEPIRHRVKAVAKEAGVDLLVSRFEINYGDPDLEIVDLTMELVNLYEPSETTLGHIRSLK